MLSTKKTVINQDNNKPGPEVWGHSFRWDLAFLCSKDLFNPSIVGFSHPYYSAYVSKLPSFIQNFLDPVFCNLDYGIQFLLSQEVSWHLFDQDNAYI